MSEHTVCPRGEEVGRGVPDDHGADDVQFQLGGRAYRSVRGFWQAQVSRVP